MTREDLKNYKYNQIWIKDQTEYIEAQKETINKLNTILSDMPKNGKYVYDKEAENLTKLMDCFNELMQKIVKEKEQQNKIVEQVNKIEFPYRNILYKVYIQGKTLVKTANEMHYSYERMKHMNGIALLKFDESENKI